MSNQNEVAKKEKSQSERFMEKVVKEYGTGVGEVALTDFQKRLAQNYFIALDTVLKSSEERRLKKSEKFRDPLPISWATVNMNKLARDVVTMARVGYDPAQPNHINLIPFKNNTTNQYDITFIEGYRGLELKATKYGLEVPDSVIVELVYSNDYFKPIKKDFKNKIESYEFSVENPFERGEIRGGFYYHIFNDTPEKNKLVVMSIAEIEKRKPKHASTEFWGGEKDKWENGQKVGKEQVEGWYDKMCWKTVYRAAYNDITIDSQKIDDDYIRLKQMEEDYSESKVRKEINENANSEFIDIEPIENEQVTESQNGPIEQTQPESDSIISNDEPAPIEEPVNAGGPGF